MVTSFAIGQKDKKEYRIGFLMNKELAGNIKNLFNLNERVVGLIIKLKLQIFYENHTGLCNISLWWCGCRSCCGIVQNSVNFLSRYLCLFSFGFCRLSTPNDDHDYNDDNDFDDDDDDDDDDNDNDSCSQI